MAEERWLLRSKFNNATNICICIESSVNHGYMAIYVAAEVRAILQSSDI